MASLCEAEPLALWRPNSEMRPHQFMVWFWLVLSTFPFYKSVMGSENRTLSRNRLNPLVDWH